MRKAKDTITNSTDVSRKLGKDKVQCIQITPFIMKKENLKQLQVVQLQDINNVNQHLQTENSLDVTSDTVWNPQPWYLQVWILLTLGPLTKSSRMETNPSSILYNSLSRVRFTVFEFLASFIRFSAILTSSSMTSCSEFFRELRWSWTFTQIRSIICRESLTVWADPLTWRASCFDTIQLFETWGKSLDVLTCCVVVVTMPCWRRYACSWTYFRVSWFLNR